MELIIVESPTKAKTLSRFLGKGYSVEATMGHIKDLPKSKLGVDVEKNFKPDYLVVDKKIDTIKRIVKEAKKADKIYLASDPDREGEAISAHVKEILTEKENKIDADKLSRIVFHEITKEAVEEALAHARRVDKNLVDAQIARRVLDRLVGYTLSPLLWKKVRRGLSAGRVQSVAVRLIVEKEKEIEKFKAVEYWEIRVVVKPLNSSAAKSFTVELVKIDNKKAEVGNGKDALGIVKDLEGSTYVVDDVKKREVRKNPYPPFTTSTLAQAGARLFGWPAKRTMSVAQSLYEEGLITYHRTDSLNLSKAAVDKARDFIKTNYGENYLPSTAIIYKTKSKNAQEAHEAIRPTEVGLLPNAEIGTGKYAADAKKLYELIWRRFVACQMTPSVSDQTTIEVEATPNSKQSTVSSYLLRASGQVMKFDGWRKVVPAKLDAEGGVTLPEVVKSENLDLVKVDSEQKFTQPPARFNEASLIKTLEELGIGRPSTYAPIISTIQARQYVQKDDGKLKPTPVGTAVTDFLLTNFADIVDYSFTRGMEEDLDKVAEGKNDWEKMMGNFYKPYDKKIKDVTENSQRVKIETEKTGEKCPVCNDGEQVIRIGRFGKFISCSNFPECEYKAKYLEKIGMKCPTCTEKAKSQKNYGEIGEVILKKSSWKKFYGCSRYPDCDFASWKNPMMGEDEAGVAKPKQRVRRTKNKRRTKKK